MGVVEDRNGETLKLSKTEIENTEILHEIVYPLLDWYDRNARDLPWRKDPSPYRVWVSEIMLQQTRVETGKDYFLRWMEELPDVEALANVTDEKLMKLWEGLGYYNRARNLKKAAGIVMEQYGGTLPDSYEALLSLPGIGPYTAGAVGSIAFGLPVAAVDGNVLRVVSRLTADKEDIGSSGTKKRMEQLLMEIIPIDRPGDFNQALMELGALVCIRGGAPRCDTCSLSGLCQAYSLGIEAMLPVKVPKKARKIEKRTILILRNQEAVLLHKRDEKGLLAGLWELPGLDGELAYEQVMHILNQKGFVVKDIRALPAAKHIFSHIEWHMTGFAVDLELSLVKGRTAFRDSVEGAWGTGEVTEKDEACSEGRDEIYIRDKAEQKCRWVWASQQELKTKYALPSAFRYYKEFLL